MNREIKFRAWNIPNKLMYQNVQDGILAKNEKGQLVLGVSLGKLSKDAGSVLMQFSGLLDADKKEIYEGDILKFMHHLHRVFYVAGGLVINSHLDDFYKDYTPFWESLADMQTSQWVNQCKIIGNIYEDPKLLSVPVA